MRMSLAINHLDISQRSSDGPLLRSSSKELQQTKKRLGVGPPKPLRGATPDPLDASTWERKPTPAPTSPAGDFMHSHNFMHSHKWKRGAVETEATVKEIRRKASKIAPAYNKGALQYLPDEKDR